MEWHALLADLAGTFDAAEAAAFAAEVDDRTERDVARIRLVDRLRAAADAALSLRLSDGTVLHGRLVDVGPDWLLLRADNAQETLLPLGAVVGFTGLGRGAVAADAGGLVWSRLDLRYALRVLARDGVEVAVTTAGGTVVAGRLVRVGADWMEVTEPTLEGPRPARSHLLALSTVLAVRSR